MTILESLKQQLFAALAILKGMDKQSRLYDAAISFLGTDASPSDAAPDEYGCADSLSRVLQKAFPELQIALYLSTRSLGNHLINSPSFRASDIPEKGDIILAITGTGNGRVLNGHCGVVGKNTSPDGTLYAMSNDSRFGTWEANFTVASFKRYYREKGGMHVYFFKPV